MKTRTDTTLHTITDAQLEALRAEAGSAGDRTQVALCDRALAGSRRALASCVAVIADAEAQS